MATQNKPLPAIDTNPKSGRCDSNPNSYYEPYYEKVLRNYATTQLIRKIRPISTALYAKTYLGDRWESNHDHKAGNCIRYHISLSARL